MRDTTTLFAVQWAGLVAQVEMFGVHAPGSTLLEHEGMVGSAVASVPDSSIVNAALTCDPAETPHDLRVLAHHFRDAGARKWGLWVPGDHEQAARAATSHGLRLDSTPAAMVADLARAPAEAAPREPADRATIGRINDAAYGLESPKLGPPISALPPVVLTYQARGEDGTPAAVAMAFDHGNEDTAVWFVATRPDAQRRGLARRVLTTLLRDAADRGNRTASLQSSAAGRGVYESVGFEVVGTVHLYEERLD